MIFNGEVLQVAIGQSSTNTKVVLRRGAQTDAEIFSAVGRALSLWERSEDVLMGLFRQLTADMQPIALGSYANTPSRGARKKMMQLALEENARNGGPATLPTELRAKVEKNLKRADDLAEKRNEIAHGQCTRVTMHENGQLALEGFFLLPPTYKPNETGRALKFAYDPTDIEQFRAKTGECLTTFDEAYSWVTKARQDFENALPPENRVMVMLARSAVLNSAAIPHFLQHVELSREGQELAERFRALTTQ